MPMIDSAVFKSLSNVDTVMRFIMPFAGVTMAKNVYAVGDIEGDLSM
jgi:hypothetical protein